MGPGSEGIRRDMPRNRRWRGGKLERDAALRESVLGYLQCGWSPTQVSGRLAQAAGKPVIAYETGYRFIYAQMARTKDYSWRHYLPRGKSKCGWRGRRGGSPAAFIAQRRSLAERPQTAADRQTPGHWEVDLMLFRTYGQAVLTLHERHSRLLIATRPPGKAAEPIATAMHDLFASLPPEWRQTATFDNGTEFADFVADARHYRLHDLGGCRPSSAIPTLRGRKAASKMSSAKKPPSGACGAGCHARPIWRP